MNEKLPVKEEALISESPNLKYELEKQKLRKLRLKLDRERYRKLRNDLELMSSLRS